MNVEEALRRYLGSSIGQVCVGEADQQPSAKKEWVIAASAPAHTLHDSQRPPAPRWLDHAPASSDAETRSGANSARARGAHHAIGSASLRSNGTSSKRKTDSTTQPAYTRHCNAPRGGNIGA